jgi:hypothetical protein
LAKFGKCFAKLLEHQFSSFAKKTRIASAIGKLLEMLLLWSVQMLEFALMEEQEPVSGCLFVF